MTNTARSSKLSLLLPLLLASSTALTAPAFSADVNWTGANGSDWFNSTNWDSGSVPTSADHVLIANSNRASFVATGGAAVANTIALGNLNDNGALFIANGSSLTSNSLIAGLLNGPASSVTIDGSGAALRINAAIVAGREGNATFSAMNGATVTSQSAVFGEFDGAVGQGFVSNAATWTLTGSGLSVGSIGRGELSVSNGGVVSLTNASGDIRIGNSQTAATSAVTVDGAGSRIELLRTVVVGARGAGALTVLNGGHFVVNSGGAESYIVAGSTNDATSNGTINVTGNGSLIQTDAGIVIGGGTASNGGATGVMTVNDGARAVSAFGMIGRFQGATGSVNVNGAASSWTLSGRELSVGLEGAGSLNVTGGGRVALTDAIGDLRIGNNLSGASAVKVYGAGSALTLKHTAYIGARGTGLLEITNGGAVTVTSGGSDSYVIAGSTTDNTSYGTIIVRGQDSKLDTDATIVIGGYGRGELTVSDQATVSSSNAMIGRFRSGRGEVSIDGAGSAWNLTGGKIHLGMEGEGALSVLNSGVLSLAGSQGDILIATGPAAKGSLTVQGSGTAVNFGGQLFVGNQGEGALTISNGGVVSSSSNNGSDGYVIAGFTQGARGTIAVSGVNSSLSTPLAIVIGGRGVGTMRIADGGHVVSTYGKIGEFAGSSGDVTVNNDNTVWQVSQTLIVGGRGNGVLTISGNAQVVAGTVDIGASGTVNIGAAAGQAPGASGALAASNIVNNGQIVLNHTSSGLWLSAAMSGSGRLDARAGTTMLNGDSSAFSGTSLIASGATLQVGDGGTSGALGGSILNQGSLVFDRSDASDFSGSISGTGTLTKNGAGALSLASVNNYSGGTTIAAGSLLGSASSFGSGQIFDNAALVIDQAVDGMLANTVTGSGTFEKRGAGNLVLAGSNGYTGGTTISEGILTGTESSFGSGSIVDNAVLTLATGSIGTLSNTISGTGRLVKTGNGNTTLAASNTYSGGTTISEGTLTGTTASFGAGDIVNNAHLVIDQSSPGTLSNTISGAGDLFIGVGNVITLASVNTYSGGTTALNSTLVGSAASFGSGQIVLGNARIEFIQSADAVLSNSIIGMGSSNTVAKEGSGNLTFTGNNTYAGRTIIWDGTLTGSATSFGSGEIENYADFVLDQASNGIFANVISGWGNLAKTGAGRLDLTGSSGTFRGMTSVTGGTLAVNGAFGSSASTILVSNGATLAGSGTIGGSVSIADGILAPGNSPGTLTINGDLTLASNSVLNYELGQAGVAGGAYNDYTVVHGNLTLDGTLNVAQSAGGTYGAGVYHLISYDGTLTDNGLSLGTMPSGSTALIQTSVAHQINLIETMGQTLRFWDGSAGPKNDGVIQGGAGTWTAASNSDNWTNAAGSINAAYANSGFAIFGGTGGAVSVDNSMGQVQVSGLQFASDGYEIGNGAIELLSGSNVMRVGDGTADGAGMTGTISSVIQGAGGLNKTDLGTLILTGANTYTGGTIISGGTLQIGMGGSMVGDIVNNATLAFQGHAYGTTFAGNISGTGRLDVLGSMSLTLTGNNTYTGRTEIGAGTLNIGNGGTTGSIVGDVHTDDNQGNDGWLRFNRSDSVTFAGNISGLGHIAQHGTGNLTLSGTNTYSGGTDIWSGTLTGTTTSLGTGTINAWGTLALNQSVDGTLANTITGGGAVTKMGSGKLSFAGDGSGFRGTTSVLGGTLAVDGTLGDASSTVLVSNGARLAGSGTIGGSVSIADGILAPGNSPGTLTINGNLTLASNSVLNYELGQAGVVGGAYNDHTVVHGNLTLDGTLNVAQSAGGNFGPGVYRIISYDGTLTDNGLLVGTVPNGSVNTVQTSIAGQVNLVSTLGQSYRFWDGAVGPKNNNAIEGGSGIWTLASGDNWTSADGSFNGSYANGVFAVFGGTGGIVTVDNTGGQVEVAGLQFAANGYNVEGEALELLSGYSTVRVGDGTPSGAGFTSVIDSVLQGQGGINKSDLGTLVLNGANTYTGGTLISGGKLIGSAASFGTGAIVNNAALSVDSAVASSTLVNTVTGTGSLTKTGFGNLILSGNNTYAGGTTIQAGILTGSASSFGSGPIANEGVLYFDQPTDAAFSNTISGTGMVSKVGTGDLRLSGVNTYSGFTIAGNGRLIGSASSFGTGRLSAFGEVNFDQVTDGTFANEVNGSGTITKTGAGTLSLTGDGSAFSGATSVTGGTLSVNGTLGTASSTVSVSNGGKLGGSGTIGGNVTIADGVLAPGNSAGTLTINGNLTLASNSILNYELGQAGTVGGAYNDHTIVHGNLTLDGTLNLAQSAGGTFGAGIYRLISYDGTLTDNGLLVGSSPAGSVNIVQTSIAGQVNLINTSGQIFRFWDGASGGKHNGVIEGGAGTWTAASSGANNDNWTVASGALNAPYTNGAFAVFGGTGGAVTVDNSAGQIQVSGLQFASNGYTIGGGAVQLLSGSNTVRVGDGTASAAAMSATISSVLQGTGGIDKTDLGTLVLTGANTYSGGTTVSGGTLVGSSTSFGSGAIANNAALVLNQTANGTLANAVSGSGTLTKTGAGNLTLAGTNSYTGGTTISAGTLTGSTGSFGSGAITDNAALTLDQVIDATFSNLISGSGSVNKSGAGSLTLAANNSYAGGTTVSGGTLVGSATSFGSGGIVNNAALVLDQSSNASMANSLSGAGTLTKTGAGVLELSGNSAGFTGAVALAQGGLNVTGSLAGAVVSAQAGTSLSGSGTIGSVTALAGSAIAPGNGPGTLNFAGNYRQAAGSVYTVDVVPGTSTSDRLVVGGAAVLDNGAVLNVSRYSTAPYAANAHYTVLTAAGGVTGTYVLTGDRAISNFYSLAAVYDANNVYLDAVQTRSFVNAAQTPNQIAVAGGLQSLPAGNGLHDLVGSLASDSAARAAFDQLSGEVHSTIKGAMIEDSRFVRQAGIDRIRSAFDTVGAPAVATASYGLDGLSVWSNGYGAWSNETGNGNAAGLSDNVGGFVAGADASVFDTWRVGLLAGYGRSAYGVNERGSSGTADSYSVGAYGGTQLDALGLRLGTAYSWNTVATSRSLGFGGFSDQLKGKYTTGLFQAFGEAGYRIDAGETPIGELSFEPFAGLAHVRVNSGGFTEQGGLAALTAASGATSVTFSTIGLRAATEVAIGEYTLTATGTVAWRHAFGDTTPMTTLSFAGSDPFGIGGLPVVRDAALIDAGLSTKLGANVSLGMSYTGQFGNGAQSQGIRGSLNVKF